MKLQFSRFTYIILLSFLLVACTNANIEKKTNTIHIGLFPNITHAQGLILKNQHILEQEFPDLTIVWTAFNAGPEELEAFYSSQLDLGFIGPVPAINGYSKTNGDLLILSGVSNAGTLVVVPSDSTISSIHDLENKIISVPQLGNTQDLILRSLLTENGLEDRARGGNVDIVAISNADVKVSFDQKQIDAAILPEPWATRLVVETNARILLDEDQVWKNGSYSTAVLIGRKEFIENNPDITNRVIELLEETTSDLSQPNTLDLIINNEIEELTGKSLANEVLVRSLENIKFSSKINFDSIQNYANLSLEYGYINESVDINKMVWN